MAEKLVWTVLPYGFDSHGHLRVSIVLSPRLTPDPDSGNAQALLSGYPDFLDWPKTLAQLSFSLKTDSATFDLKVEEAAKSGIWKKLFTPDMSVAPFVYTDMSQHNLNSFPVRHVVRFLKDHYGDLAAQQGLDRPALFPIGASPFKPMITQAAGGERWGQRKYYHRRPNGIGDLLVNSDIDQRVRGEYFGKHSKYVPEQIVGIDGRLTANKKHTPTRALPGDLPPGLKNLFGLSTPAYALYQANRFYSREATPPPYAPYPDPTAIRQPIPTPKYDFHKVVGSFGDAPAMMRTLGLVIDATVVGAEHLIEQGRAADPAGITGTMQVVVKHRGQSTAEDSTPRTAWHLTGRRFIVLSRTTTDVTDGFLALAGAMEVARSDDAKAADDKSPFSLVQVDADGSAIKTVNFVNSTLTHLQNTPNPDDHDPLGKPAGIAYTTNNNQEATPALRSAGITVTRHNRATDLAADLAAHSLKNDALDDASQSSNVLLYAEDVLRGFRVDVREKRTDQWRSLCARVANYRATEDQSPLIDDVHDEGCVQGPSTTTQAAPDDVDNNKDTQDHYLHEALFKWAGWSLVAERPGKRIVPVNEHGLIQEETVQAQTDADAADGASPMLTRTHWQPGTLPRLRFGETYRLRARTVDLAGNSLKLTDKSIADLEQASDEITYRRLEPVDPPVLSLHGRVSEGESLERAVIRSDVVATEAGYQSLSTSEYIAQGPYALNDPLVSGFAYVDVNLRHVVPPKTSQTLAEQHGCFDDAFDAPAGPGKNAAIHQAFDLIAKREAGTLYDGGAAVKIITPAIDGASKEQALTQSPPEGFRLQPGEYVVHTEDRLATPYLPDPAAAAVVLRGVPGIIAPVVIHAADNVHADYIPLTQELVLYVPLKGTWPEIDGFRIAIVELAEQIDAVPCTDTVDATHAVPTWDSAKRTLTIFLRKGEIAPVRYSTGIRVDHILKMGLPAWTSTPLGGVWAAILGICGANWTMTPDRTLTLVHATQHPVCEPTFLTINGHRDDGATWIDFQRETFVRYHARSTGQLEVMADWMEWIDDVTSGKPPYRKHVTARLKPVRIEQPGIAASEPTRSDYGFLGPVPDSGTVRPHVRHDFGDQKFRFVRYSLLATTRFREYLPPSITADPAQVTRLGQPWLQHALALPANYYDDTVEATDVACGAPLLQSNAAPQGYIVPASGRPQPPHLVYIMPTQHWSDSQVGGVHRVVRDGGTLRIYLERPWFTSGDGELLGVVVISGSDPKKLADLKDPNDAFVSQWGQDPLFDSTLPRGTLTAAAFPNAVYAQTEFLPEANQDMLIAGHRVYFDAERNEWFADVRIDAGDSYMPFVRLCLVRYQPYASYDVRLSTVVVAPYAQLLPRRRIDVTEARDAYMFKVYGPVPTQGAGSTAAMYPGVSSILTDYFGPGPGHNRIEVVLQWQNTTFETDLDWFDVPNQPHPSADATPQQAVLGLLDQIGATMLTSFAQEQHVATTTPALGREAATANVAQAAKITHLTPDLIAQLVSLDTCVWVGRISIPANLQGKRLRLMLREYERHLSDQEVIVQPFSHHQPKVVERLVFAREFPLTPALS